MIVVIIIVIIVDSLMRLWVGVICPVILVMIGSAIGIVVVVVSGHAFLRFLSMLLHVLGEIGLLGVGFSTKMTNMCLQMLRLLMFWDVVKKGALISETFIATVAFVWFVRLMTSGMRLKIGQLRKGLVTSHVTTFVRLVTSMRSYMLLEVRKLSEFPLTNLTSVRLDTQMNAGVL